VSKDVQVQSCPGHQRSGPPRSTHLDRRQEFRLAQRACALLEFRRNAAVAHQSTRDHEGDSHRLALIPPSGKVSLG